MYVAHCDGRNPHTLRSSTLHCRMARSEPAKSWRYQESGLWFRYLKAQMGLTTPARRASSLET